jgi:hypothetical protein
MSIVPPIYCITLREFSKRKQEAQQYFQQIGANVFFVNGFCGRSLGLATKIPMHMHGPPEGQPWYIGAGQAALILSNIMVLRYASMMGHEMFMIIEDDARFISANWREDIMNILREAPPDWDMIHLEHCCTAGKPATRISPRLCQIKYPLCTAAILYRSKAIPTITDNCAVLHSPWDIMLAERAMPKLKCYCAVPPVMKQLSNDGLVTKTI